MGKIMKNHLFILSIALALAILLAGCATVPKCPACPPENTLFMTPSGPAKMPKGFFDTEEGRNWMHTDDYRDAMKKRGGL